MSGTDAYRKSFLALLVVFVTVTFVAVMRPFLMTVLLAAIFSGIAHPLYRSILALFRGRSNLASAATLLVLVVLVLIPFAAFVGALVSQAIQVSQTAVPWIQQQLAQPDLLMDRLLGLPLVDRLLPYRETIYQKAAELAGAAGSFVVSGLSGAARGTIMFVIQLLLFLYAMYFFLKEGGRILGGVMVHVPLSDSEKAQIVHRFVSVTKAALASTVVIGIVQGTLAGAALALAGIPGAVFWGTLMAVLSMIPGVGAALVWVPAAVYLAATGHVLGAVLVTVFCALVVGSVDNVLRPRLVGKGTRMHELLVLLSTVGGLALLGPEGFIIGPVIAALFITVWDIYGAFVRGETERAARP